jgi:hypothetical protein
VAGDDPGLAFFEFSAESATSPDAVVQANPGLGIRITSEHVDRERRSMDPRTFAVERLSVGDWPSTDGGQTFIVDPGQWAALADPSSVIDGDVTFAVDVSPDRGRASICTAGRRADGRLHVEVVDSRPGTGWVPDRLVELVERWAPLAVVIDPRSPAGALLPAVRQIAELRETSAQDVGQGCGAFFQAILEGTVAHLGQLELASALMSAATRPLGDAWAWSRRLSSADITPLVGCTLALWGFVACEGRSVDVAVNIW